MAIVQQSARSFLYFDRAGSVDGIRDADHP